MKIRISLAGFAKNHLALENTRNLIRSQTIGMPRRIPATRTNGFVLFAGVRLINIALVAAQVATTLSLQCRAMLRRFAGRAEKVFALNA